MLFFAWLMNAVLFYAGLFLAVISVFSLFSSWTGLIPLVGGISLVLMAYGISRLIKRKATGYRSDSELGPI